MENESNNNGIKIVTGILAVLLVVAGAFAVKLYNQEKDTKSQLTKEKQVVMADLKEMVDKYDVVIEENDLKDTELNEARDRIQNLIDSIDTKDATIASLSRYRNEVFKLRNERDYLFAQNDSLRGMNQQLAMRIDSTTYELEVVRTKGDSLSLENEQLSERVTLGAALAANKLRSVGVIERNSGRLIENDNVNRVDKIRTCFTVPQNRLTEPGDKELYVQVLGPNQEILGDNQTAIFTGSREVEDAETGEMTTEATQTSINYSTISSFYYENQALDICENIAPIGDKFAKGTYQVNIFDKSQLIAQTSFVLD